MGVVLFGRLDDGEFEVIEEAVIEIE